MDLEARVKHRDS